MRKPIDLTGQTFGEWEVLNYAGNKYWNCKCSCGTAKSIHGYSLTSSKSTSCGCVRKVLNSLNKIDDLVSMTFGEWEVLEYKGNSMWLCKCSCGIEREVKAQSIKSGVSKSCGHNTTAFKDLTGQIFNGWKAMKYLEEATWQCECMNCKAKENINAYRLTQGTPRTCDCSKISHKLMDIVGQKFGELVAVKYVGCNKWLCKCSCGNESIHFSHNLRKSETISCGCNEIQPYSKEDILTIIQDFIKKHTRLPYQVELCTLLDRSTSSTSRYVNRYNIHEFINKDTKSSAERELLTLFPTKHICSRGIIGRLELDLYYPNKELALEFNGTYWHNYLLKGKKYHQNKSIECAKRKIQLVHIFEYEWVNPISKEKIISIIKRRLNMDTEITRIYGRSTKVLEINNSEAVEFCNKYHLQNGTNSAINIGLHYNSELIGVMTFGKPRFSSKQQWEIFRLCFKSNITVVGGAEKLFKYFLSKYNPDSIISYCDVSKFRGEVYKKLGFIVEALTEPNYVWADSAGNTFSRYQTQKYKLLELGLGDAEDTENSIMDGLGYYKLYDSGNLRFTWSK